METAAHSMDFQSRILVVDDDPDLRRLIADFLAGHGYQVSAADNVAAMHGELARAATDLVILDVMMPKQSGYDVCREIRQRDARVPILFLTAKGEEVDKVVGLKLGADDYVLKPFGVHELLARVEALLRRARASAAGPAAAELPAVFRLGAAEVDRGRFTATVAGRSTTLTMRELKLAEVFAANPGQVLARDALLNAVWGVDYFGTTRTLDQHVAQLRKKIEVEPENPQTIVTVHGVGYRCEAAGLADDPA